jgi:hypothetical protein
VPLFHHLLSHVRLSYVVGHTEPVELFVAELLIAVTAASGEIVVYLLLYPSPVLPDDMYRPARIDALYRLMTKRAERYRFNHYHGLPPLSVVLELTAPIPGRNLPSRLHLCPRFLLGRSNG